MLSILAMAASRSLPIVKADGSSKRRGSEACWAGAGDGVPGAFWVADDGAGAAGAAGVCAGAGAGVEGAGLLDTAGAFGWEDCQRKVRAVAKPSAHLGHHAHNEALLLYAVGLNRVGILQNLACVSFSAVFGRGRASNA
jgi:hypothetical protein